MIKPSRAKPQAEEINLTIPDRQLTAAAAKLAAKEFTQRTLKELLKMERIKLHDQEGPLTEPRDLTDGNHREYFAFRIQIKMTQSGHLRSVAINLDFKRSYLQVVNGFPTHVARSADLILLAVDDLFANGCSEESLAKEFEQQLEEPAKLSVMFPQHRHCKNMA